MTFFNPKFNQIRMEIANFWPLFGIYNPQNVLGIVKLIKQPFSIQNSETTYSQPFKPISAVLYFLPKLGFIDLNHRMPNCTTVVQTASDLFEPEIRLNSPKK